jgi:Family of unknown function (DUF5694)
MQHVLHGVKKYSAFVFSALAAISFSPMVHSQPKAKAVAPIEVMIVGAYHMGNPGLDVNNVKVDSVLTPEKQKQLVEAVNRLAKFKPNKIAVEMVAKQPDMTAGDFEKFTPASLLTDANEITQIAYRLANQLGHKVVYAIDEQSETIDYFPYDKVEAFAKANSQENLMAGGLEWGKVATAEFEKAQKTKTVTQLLLEINKPQRAMDEMRLIYYPFLGIGDQKSQVGAELNAGWYQRNAKIFAKLNLVAKPGDKILVLFGSGHNYWLRHFVNLMPGYKLVDMVPYLK